MGRKDGAVYRSIRLGRACRWIVDGYDACDPPSPTTGSLESGDRPGLAWMVSPVGG